MDRVYDKKKIIIKKSALTKESVKDRFDYIKEVSKIVSIQTDKGKKLLFEKYNKISFFIQKVFWLKWIFQFLG